MPEIQLPTATKQNLINTNVQNILSLTQNINDLAGKTIKSIQKGIKEGEGNVSIAAIDINKSILLINNYYSSTTTAGGALIDSTTIWVAGGAYNTPKCVWQVIEFY